MSAQCHQPHQRGLREGFSATYAMYLPVHVRTLRYATDMYTYMSADRVHDTYL